MECLLGEAGRGTRKHMRKESVESTIPFNPSRNTTTMSSSSLSACSSSSPPFDAVGSAGPSSYTLVSGFPSCNPGYAIPAPAPPPPSYPGAVQVNSPSYIQCFPSSLNTPFTQPHPHHSLLFSSLETLVCVQGVMVGIPSRLGTI